MNLGALPVPKTSTGMQQALESYYHTFHLEMVRMSNSSLNDYVSQYVSLLIDLSKHQGTPNIIRAAIGVVALHRFGYSDFRVLSGVFDRLIPQIDPEYVKFTSWCAGKLIHHPDVEQSRYATHLFERCIDWSRSKGRRARPLAAATLISALATNAGSSVVVFFPLLQSAVWILVSHPSTQVLKATADAIAMYTRAVVRYGRSDLVGYLDFFTQLCMKLLNFGDPIREYAALLLFEVLIHGCPGHFLPKMLSLYNDISEAVCDEPMLVQGAAYAALAALSEVDPKQFVEVVADDLFDKTEDVVMEFPKEIVGALCLMCRTVPEFMKEKSGDLLKFLDELRSEPNSAFMLMTAMMKSFGSACFREKREMILNMMQNEMTPEYQAFFVALIENDADEELKERLCERIEGELNSEHPDIALKMVAEMKQLRDRVQLFECVMNLTASECQSIATRTLIAPALWNLTVGGEPSHTYMITKKLLQMATFDQSVVVRCSILQVLYDNCDDTLAGREFATFIQMFMNDDSASVRQMVFRILAKLADANELAVAALTRSALLNSFFIIRHVPSVRQRSRYVFTLPDLIKASAKTIKAYSGGFMDIALTILTQDNPSQKWENFIEKEASMTILIGILDSVSLLAPMDPAQIAHHGDVIIPILCNMLLSYENRKLSLSILRLFLVLLSAPASDLSYRQKSPMILKACATFLARTHSRKARMATLKVLGAIGVLEVHERPPLAWSRPPENVDEKVARQFFNPNRDSEGEINDSLVVQGNASSIEQYFTAVAATSLMEIFKDDNLREFYEEAVVALVTILSHPKMFLLELFDSFVVRLLEVMETATIVEMRVYLPLFAQLIENSTNNTSPFLKASLKLIHERFCPELANQFLDLIIAFLSCLRDGFSPYASETICLLIGCLDDMKTRNDTTSKRVLQAFAMIGVFAADLLYLIVPQICDVTWYEQTRRAVRIAALETLIVLARTVDLTPYLGTIIRAISFAIFYQDQKTSSTGFELLYGLFRAQGSSFLVNAEPLLESLKRHKMETPELKKIISLVSQGEPIPDLTPPPQEKEPAKVGRKHGYAEDAVCTKVQTPNLGLGRHLEQWLRSFVLACIDNSPSDAIRACTTLAASHFPLAMRIFNQAFLSCWRVTSEIGKQQITTSFRELLLAKDNYETVAREIFRLLVFMDRVEMPLDIPAEELVSASIRYGGIAFALYVQQKLYESFPNDARVIGRLIDIYVKIGDWPNAVAIWKQGKLKNPSLNRVDVLARLRMWDQVQPVYQQSFEGRHDFESFLGLSESMASLAMWRQLMDYKPYFDGLKPHKKRQVAVYYAGAALHLGQWDTLEEILQYAPDDSTRCNALKVLNYVHKRNVDNVQANLERGYSLLASRPITFGGNNQQIHRDTIKAAQELVEICEMKRLLSGMVNSTAIEEVWNERLKTVPKDFELWLALLANRARIIDIKDDYLIQFFELKSPTLGTKLHLNAFELLFPDFVYETAPDIQKVCYIVARRSIGLHSEALSEMQNLAQTTTGDLRKRCHYFCADWILESSNDRESLQKAYDYLQVVANDIDNIFKEKTASERKFFPVSCHSECERIVDKIHKTTFKGGTLVLPSQILKELKTDQWAIGALRRWAYVNADLIPLDPERTAQYVTNAIDALTKTAKLSPSFPDVVQMLNLFFEHADQEAVFEATSSCIQQLQPKLLMQASPQLLIQLNHRAQSVAKFVHETVLGLLKEHYHGLIFSIIVTTRSRVLGRGEEAKKILDDFAMEKPDVFAEVELIRKALLRVAVTWNEKVIQRITDAFDHYQRRRTDLMLGSLANILDIVKKPRCEMHHQFLSAFSKNISMLEQILKIFNPKIPNCMAQISQWCKSMQDLITEDLKRIKAIQLSAISEELCRKTDFYMAVPGTYQPGRPINHIKYFVGQFSVYMSKQQPKDVLVKGEDGNYYQYLLKGHEDLRLDERIMQFFRLINSLIMKEPAFRQNLIQTTCVIPLSISHGLVQWVPGTATLRVIVEQQRRLHNRETMEEYNLTEHYSYYSFDYLRPIQKMQIIQKIFRQVPDTDIANFFWLGAKDSEMWIRQTNTFAISCGMTSIVGYIIGLGDRHPSNLLIDHSTGKVIHIDFGDCFEKAAKRKFLAEVVPFRLTRMMARAMGAAGVDGLFRTSFVTMSQLLRDNRNVLVMVLATFVHEPLIDPEAAEEQEVVANAPRTIKVSRPAPESTSDALSRSALEESALQSSIELRSRVMQKLTGNDHGDTTLSVDEQATWLISLATSPYSLAHMYSGWCPFW